MRKRLLALLFAFSAAAAMYVWFRPLADPGEARGAQVVKTAPEKHVTGIPSRPPFGEPRGDAFAPRQWTPENPAASAPQPASAPSPPPMPYRYAGKVTHGGTEEVLLAKGDVVIPVRVGDKLDGGYRVESIDAEQIVLRYLPLGTQARIPVDSMLDIEGRR